MARKSAPGGRARTIKPTQKSVKAYYATLKGFGDLFVDHETGIRSAFQTLLADAARNVGWTLVPEQRIKVAGKTVIPDATLRDAFLPRGYWEAKDTKDDLDKEIRRKIDKGYPLNNTIFEDTRQAVLFQGSREALRADLSDPQQLADLLNRFFAYAEPDIACFEEAVGEFQERVPELAAGLAEKIALAHKDNPKFIAAFASFFDLCKTALNPNISVAAVDEMLIQHLLTERLIHNIFDYDLTQRNVIAAEVEKVIDALASQSFSRHEFLKALDRFYVAIERAARGLDDFSEKQHFLNTIYERFFQGYSVKLADTHGIVYTPQEIVDFMCASVVEVLQKEFGKSIGDKDVFIIDPCTGTGNFIVNLLRRIPKKDLPRVYKQQMFANEIMLLPYYIAALNIEHAYYELAGTYESFEGLCFVDTLDLAEAEQAHLSFMTQANTARVERQKKTPITIVIGNPPYNVGQIVHNEQNKNRPYPVIDDRIRQTYSVDSAATSVSKLSDPYVKFFRWATDRLNGRDGIVCFVSNNSFLEQIAFDGMRKHLLRDFSTIYHLDLEGNVRQNPTLSGTKYNVFGIQVGVGITIAIRRSRTAQGVVHYAAVDKQLPRHEKLNWVKHQESVGAARWQALTPDEMHTWLIPENSALFATFVPIASKAARLAPGNDSQVVFKDYSLGVATHRDAIVYDFSRDALSRRVAQFVEDYNAEVDRWKRAPQGADVDNYVRYDRIVWDRDLKKDLTRGRYAEFTEHKVRQAYYRPFCRKWLFFDRILNAEVYGQPAIFPNAVSERDNIAIWIKAGSEIPTFAMAASGIVDLMTQGGSQCFPFYTYDEDGSNRKENITDWALDQLRTHYKDRKITKWDIFYYVYGVLHHPGYREKFADNLKRELPRIPFAPDFRAFARAGCQFAELHLNYDKLEPWPLKYLETPNVPLSYRVEKMKLTKDKAAVVVNDSLTLDGVPAEVFDYRLGNRSALDWVIDQYQVSEDKRTGITSDPNRPDDPEYIVRLVGQVIRVSVETVKIVNALPAEYTAPTPEAQDA